MERLNLWMDETWRPARVEFALWVAGIVDPDTLELMELPITPPQSLERNRELALWTMEIVSPVTAYALAAIEWTALAALWAILGVAVYYLGRELLRISDERSPEWRE